MFIIRRGQNDATTKKTLSSQISEQDATGRFIRFIGRNNKTFKGGLGDLRLDNKDIKHYARVFAIFRDIPCEVLHKSLILVRILEKTHTILFFQVKEVCLCKRGGALLCTFSEVEFKYKLAWRYTMASSAIWKAVPVNGGSSLTVYSGPYIQSGSNAAENWEEGGITFNYDFPSKGPYRVRVQYGCPVSIKLPIIDPDGDNVQCRWATPAEAATISRLLPNAHLNQFLIHTETMPGSCNDKPAFVSPTLAEGHVTIVKAASSFLLYFMSSQILDINECASNPCRNGGLCLDLINNHRCHCQEGYTGFNCQTNIDECSSNPCRHNGTCIDFIDEYICQCTNEFKGDNCKKCKHYYYINLNFISNIFKII
ncbi:NOTCH2 [Mytilus edulis]|uniref:NOTCH2 n=1 Tax=Mytilus edulis TaxID=6550 RepID=A0A8S3R004_MYTED|nr:NOTCH2 [Mytilus edulis]